MGLDDYLTNIGVKEKDVLILHSSYKKIRNVFKCSIESIIDTLQKLITPHGSLIIPSFTYCLKKKGNTGEVFNRLNSSSKNGAVSEAFWKMENVIRTSSPTHSFALWGNITNYIDYSNNPSSPLGKGSVLEWMSNQNNSSVLLIGCDFSSVSFIHYLEEFYGLEYIEKFAWEYLQLEAIGVSADGEFNLMNVPGCSKSFINYENYLSSKKLIKRNTYKGIEAGYIPLQLLMKHFQNFIKEDSFGLLCNTDDCLCCKTRRMIKSLNRSL